MLLKKAWHKAKNGIINFNNIKVKIKTDKNIKVKSWWFLSVFIFWYTYTISYKVKVQNSGTVVMWIDSIEETKNNDNIEYVLEGIGIKEFTLKIKYKDGITVLPSSTNIDTILKFNFIKPESTL